MSEPLSLAFLSHAASPQAPTGAERSLSVLASGLSERGHRVAVVVPGPWTLTDSVEQRGVEVVEIPSRACWLTYHEPRPWPVAWAKWARYAWPQRATPRLRSFLGRWAPDVVHVNCLPHLRGARAASGGRSPVVWHLREILPPGPRRRRFAAEIRRRASRVVAVSRAVADWLAEEGISAQVEVIPNGVRVPQTPPDRTAARRALGLPAEGVLVGLFGQLVRHKGALEFVDAARRVLARDPRVGFVVAGSGPESFVAEVRRAMGDGDHPDRFFLLPPQPDAERLIAAVDVVCLATLTPDPLPRAVLEAMAAARPVAAFRSGGAAEMVADGETGLIVPAGDTAGLSAAIARLVADEPARRSMGQAGRRRAVAEFSVERHLDRMESLFRGLATRGRS